MLRSHRWTSYVHEECICNFWYNVTTGVNQVKWHRTILKTGYNLAEDLDNEFVDTRYFVVLRQRQAFLLVARSVYSSVANFLLMVTPRVLKLRVRRQPHRPKACPGSHPHVSSS
jgi:hypothetical protein